MTAWPFIRLTTSVKQLVIGQQTQHPPNCLKNFMCTLFRLDILWGRGWQFWKSKWFHKSKNYIFLISYLCWTKILIKMLKNHNNLFLVAKTVFPKVGENNFCTEKKKFDNLYLPRKEFVSHIIWQINLVLFDD